ncbi:unnamed protein product, partial [Polarella glacialis]
VLAGLRKLKHASASPQLSLSAQIADLSARVAACEERLGCSTPAQHGASGDSEPLRSRVAELGRRVGEIFGKRKDLQDFERNMDALDDWLQVEHAGASHVLLHRSAKRSYVAQHADQLRGFASLLREVEALEKYINPASLRELPAHGDRLRRVEANSALAVASAMQLHEQVANMAEDYHRTVIGLNEQMLHWDRLLSEKAGSG